MAAGDLLPSSIHMGPAKLHPPREAPHRSNTVHYPQRQGDWVLLKTQISSLESTCGSSSPAWGPWW